MIIYLPCLSHTQISSAGMQLSIVVHYSFKTKVLFHGSDQINKKYYIMHYDNDVPFQGEFWEWMSPDI